MSPVTTTSTPRRQAVSLSLLDRIAEEALNPAYEARARERAEAGEQPSDEQPEPGRPGRARRVPLLTTAALALVGLLVVVLVLGSRQQSATVASERAGLVTLAEQARAEVNALEDQVNALDAEVTALRELALDNEVLGQEQAQAVTRVAVESGVQAVSGPGAVVVVEDSEATDVDELGQVLDIDLQQVVNGLWAAGAEAVAVNGERVGALTAIRAVQDVILVNYDPVVSPYRVEAVGDPRTLATDFLRSPGGRWLQAVNLSAGIRFSIDSVNEPMVLPGQPVGTLRHASVPAQAGEQ